MNFAVYIVQKGTGCDYTIGCAQTTRFFSDTTREEVEKAIVEDYGDYAEDGKIAKAIIIPYDTSYEVDFQPHIDAVQKEMEEYQLQEKRHQLEQLKKELGEE